MKLHDMAFAGVTLKNLSEEQRDQVRTWRQNVLDGTGQRGLWVFGPRNCGTTYAAQATVGYLAYKDGYSDGFRKIEHVEALDLIHSLRQMWKTSSQSRDNSQDIGLWQEADESESMVNYLYYEADLLWVDDFHVDTLDWNIWRKHVQPYLERRAKHGMPTVISTTLAPNDARLPKGVVERRFITVFCNGDWNRAEG